MDKGTDRRGIPARPGSMHYCHLSIVLNPSNGEYPLQSADPGSRLTNNSRVQLIYPLGYIDLIYERVAS